jgi:hypothetical protein
MPLINLSRDEINTLTLGLGCAIRDMRQYMRATSGLDNHSERERMAQDVGEFEKIRQALVDRANAQLRGNVK